MLGIYSNDMESKEWINKTRQTSNEMDRQHEETCWKCMDSNREEQGQLEKNTFSIKSISTSAGEKSEE